MYQFFILPLITLKMCVYNRERMTEHIKAVGSRAEVFHGSAKHTSGGLRKKDLMKTKSGRIVSRKKHMQGKKTIKRLFALGYKPKKGTFKLFGKGKRTTRRARGGAAMDASGNVAHASSVLADTMATLQKMMPSATAPTATAPAHK